jgi:hypothetical protein
MSEACSICSKTELSKRASYGGLHSLTTAPAQWGYNLLFGRSIPRNGVTASTLLVI